MQKEAFGEKLCCAGVEVTVLRAAGIGLLEICGNRRGPIDRA